MTTSASHSEPSSLPEEELHPLALEVAAFAEDDPADEARIVLPTEVFAFIEEGVRALAEDPTLEHALRSLVAVGQYLGEDLGQEDLEARIYEAAAVGTSALLTQRAEGLAETVDEASAASQALHRFRGEGLTAPRAPMHDQKPSEGFSVRELGRRGPITGR